MDAAYRQSVHRFRFEWGAEGVDALDGCAVLVVVDVLSFSTATTIVAARGGSVLPLRPSGEPALGEPAVEDAVDDPAVAAARARGAVLAGDREWTLRPSSLTAMEAGVLLGLPSPNGVTLCTRAARTGARVLVGCLRNAAATARAALGIGGPVGIIATGERWGVDAGPLRAGVEDLLGAGAVLAALDALAPGELSAEARTAVAAFTALRGDVAGLLADCVSGRELISRGHADDVGLAAERDVTDAVGELRDGVIARVECR